MKLITTKVYINGLYEWRSCWKNDEVCKKWNDFWDSKEANSIFWNSYKKDEGFGYTRYLVNTNCVIYLHPMGFDVLMKKLGKTTTYKNGIEIETYMEIEELEDILKKCCEYCGGSYEMNPLKFHEIEA